MCFIARKSVVLVYLAILCSLPIMASEQKWEGIFTGDLNGWRKQNHNESVTMSVEKFADEKAFVVRRAASNIKGGTAWELRGERFPVNSKEKITVVVRARGTVESMIVPHGYKESYMTAVRWYDSAGCKLDGDSAFGIDISDIRWQYSFIHLEAPKNAAFAEVSIGADRPDFKAGDVFAVSMLKVVSTDSMGESGSKSELRDDGTLLVDGEPYFPIGIYAVRPCAFNGFNFEKAISDLKDAGFNTVLNGDSARHEEFMAIVERMGMKTMLMPGGKTFNADIYADGIIGTWRKHRSVIAWYVADDTSSHASPGEVADRHRVCRAMDPNRLTLQADPVLMDGHNRYAPYVHCTDIFLPEIYPYTDSINGDEIANVVRDMRSVNKALADAGRPVKSIWPIMQFFTGWSLWKCFPSEDQLRAQCYAVITQKARGLLLYLYASRNEDKNKGAVSTSERWKATKRVIGEIASIKSDLLLRDAVDQPEAQVLEGPILDAAGQPSISLLLKSGENPLLVAVNSANAKVRAQFAVNGFEAVEEIFEKRTIRIGKDGFADEFSPIGVHVYRLTKNK